MARYETIPPENRYVVPAVSRHCLACGGLTANDGRCPGFPECALGDPWRNIPPTCQRDPKTREYLWSPARPMHLGDRVA